MKTPHRHSLHTGLILFLLSALALQAASALRIDWQLHPSFALMAGGGGDAGLPVVSADGRFVLFASTANNLVLTSSNAPIPVSAPAALNVYLRDRASNSTLLVSANLSDTGGGNGDSLPVSISTNGQFVLFESAATNLVAGDTNGVNDVFVRDVISNVTVLVSVGTNATSGRGVSRNAAMTPDARYVAFASAATDLAAGDTNQNFDVYVRDMVSNATELVGAGTPPAGNYGYPVLSDSPAISSDGRYVAYFSTAAKIPQPGGVGEVYLRDLTLGTTTWVGTNARAIAYSILGSSNIVSCNLSLSGNGDYVAFEAVTNFYTAYSSMGIILRHHLLTGVTETVATHANVPPGRFEGIRSLEMTADGRFIAFVGNVTNAPAWENSAVYLWDALAGTNVLVSAAHGTGVPASGTCGSPTLSEDGRFVAFVSSGTNLVTNALSGEYHAYVRDLQAGTTVLVNAGPDGTGVGVGPESCPSLSADGQLLAFDTFQPGFVPGDLNANRDVFVVAPATTAVEWASANADALPGTSPTLSWLTNGLASFEVQFKSNLSDPDWQGATGGITIIGKRAYFTDLAPVSAQRFYRVLAY